MFAGFEGKPEEVLNGEEEATRRGFSDLKTNAEGVACYKDIPFTTSAGVPARVP